MNDIQFMVDIISLYKIREDLATYQIHVEDYNDIQFMVDIIPLYELRKIWSIGELELGLFIISRI